METLVLRSFKLPLSLDESLAAHAEHRGVTKSDLVRELLRRGLEAGQSPSDMTPVMTKLDTIVEKLSMLDPMREKLSLLDKVERKLGTITSAVTSLTELMRPTGRGNRTLEVLQGRRAPR